MQINIISIDCKQGHRLQRSYDVVEIMYMYVSQLVRPGLFVVQDNAIHIAE